MYGLRVKNLLVATSLWLVCSAAHATTYSWQIVAGGPVTSLFINGIATTSTPYALELFSGDTFQTVTGAPDPNYRVDGGGPVLLARSGTTNYTIQTATSVQNLGGGSVFNFTGNSTINVTIFGSVQSNTGTPAFTTDFSAGGIGAMNITMSGLGSIFGNILAAPAVSGVITHNSIGNINGDVQLGNTQQLHFGPGGSGGVDGDITGRNNTSSMLISRSLILGNALNSVQNVNQINITGGTTTSNGTISGVNNFFVVGPSATLTLSKVISGSGSMTINGTANVNIANGLAMTGTLNNAGILNVNQNLSMNNTITNSGTITIAANRTFTTGGNFTITAAGIAGTGSGASYTNNGTLNYSSASSNGLTLTGSGSTFLNAGTLNVLSNLNLANPNTINTGSIVISNGITLTNTGSGTMTHNGASAAISGAGSFTNAGTFTVNSAVASNGIRNTGALTNSGIFNIQNDLTLSNQSSITNSGSMVISSGKLFTNSTTMTQNTGGTISGAGAFTNSGVFNYNSTTNNTLTFSGAFINSGTLNVQDDMNLAKPNVTNSGTISISAGQTFTNTVAGVLTYIDGATMTGAGAFTNVGTLNFNSTDSLITGLNFTGLFTNSGILNVNENLTRANITTNSGAINILTGKVFRLTGDLSGNGTFSLPAGATLIINVGSFTLPTPSSNFSNQGTTRIIGASALPSGLVGSGSSVLYIGNGSTTTTITPGGAISGISQIEVLNAATFTASSNVTGISNKFTVASGGTANFTAALTGTGASFINNAAILNFNAASSVSGFNGNGGAATSVSAIAPFTNQAGALTTFTGSNISSMPYISNFGTITFSGASTTVASTIPNFNEFANSIINFNSNITLSGTNIVYAEFDGVAGQVNNTSLTIGGSSTLALTNGSSITGIKSTTINTGSTLSMASGSTVSTSGSSSLVINGTLDILTGSTFTINSGSNVSGSGNILNNGNFNIDSTNFSLGGNFNNQSGGVFNITGTPTITFGGVFTNDGLIVSTFNSSNSLPQINIGNPGGLANGTIAIGYVGNYIAGGNYPFITATSAITDIGAASLPQPNLYIRSWSLNTSPSNVLNVAVDRIGFGGVATDPNAQLIGDFMEQIGSNNPSAAQLAILNELEQITSVSELNQALLELMPPEYVPLQTLSLLQSSNQLVQGRIMQARYFSSGDSTLDHGVWIRPTGGSARQSAKDNLPGYNSSYNGVIGGMDSNISPRYKMGAALSVYHSTVNDNINTSSVTRINSYQAMVYGTVKSQTGEYLDWIINGGINQYHGIRGIVVGDVLNSLAVGHYTGQQFSVKTIASKQFKIGKYYQLTPLASAQYGFLRQLSYTEEGAGPWNLAVQPNNINLFQVGIGAQFAVPFDQGKTTSIPEIHTQLLVDAKGGAVQSTSQFIDGGPLMTSSVQPGRLILQLGASLTFSISEDIQLIANYDYEVRHRYQSHEVYLNLRYMF